MREKEYNLVEKPALNAFEQLGYDVHDDNVVEESPDDRENLRDPLLEDRLRDAIQRLNPWIDENNLNKVVNQLKKVQAADTMRANNQVHQLLVQHTAVEQDRGRGRKNQTVKYIDWEEPENNEFLALNQFKVAGDNETIKPDVVVFVNGIPLGVIECKSPTLTDPREEAHDQLRRYQNLRDRTHDEGAERLFWYTQFVVATWNENAEAGTYKTPAEKYKPWKDPYPASDDLIKDTFDKDRVSPQDRLIYSIFKPERLLDMVQHFTVFEEKGQGMVKMVARYQQYRAVQKSLERIRTRDSMDRQGGVVWHTQGSGKSLTMLFLGLKLRRRMDNPTMLLVTDRIALDRQIKSTFDQCGFPHPERADSIDDLRELLQQGEGRTVTTLIQKFQERDDEEEFPVLSDREDIYVMVDEAHRTQYKYLAANMRTALPNAFYIGFSGTPIEKEKRHTPKTFGDYIDTYTIDQSIKDGTTLEILYQGRLSELHLEDTDLDTIFDRVFSDRTEEEKREIRKRYAQEKDLAEAPKRIEKIVLDMIDHYEKKISDPSKAMVVTSSRRAAVTYKEKMDKFNAPESAVVISGEHNDPHDIKKHVPSDEQIERIKERFHDPNDPLKFLIVCKMLTTGFDAPIAQVMYLDRPMKEHDLLQAIARVNRPMEDKNYGLVIDYWGISDHLHEALQRFAREDVEGAMTEITDDEVISRLEAAHRKAMSYFESQDLDDLEACVQVLEPEATRIEFNKAFKKFSKMMDIVLPEPHANKYKSDLKTLGEIYELAKKRYRDESMNLTGCGEKVREIIQEHVTSTGIEVLNEEPVSIMQENEFDDQLSDIESDKARASEMQHAIQHEINVRMDRDPVFYESLQEKVEKLIQQYNEKRIEEKEVIHEYRDIIRAIRSREVEAQEKGLANSTQLGFYHMLGHRLDVPEAVLPELTKEIVSRIEAQMVVDWKNKVKVQKQMRADVKKYLVSSDDVPSLSMTELDALTNQLIELARENY